MPDILDQIVENKRKEVLISKKKLPLAKLQKGLLPSEKNFFSALKGKNNIIAEIKYKSPSAGKIGKKRSIKEIATAYNKYASAISVLTDKKFFAGDLKYIKETKKYTQLPILRKDFIIDEYQIYEARYFGADAILLIASILSAEEIEKYLFIARKLGMEALVETKTKEEIEKVLRTSARIIGINNRNLADFKITLNTTKELKKLIPAERIVVSESGIYTKADILDLDTNAALIGTSLIEAKDISEKLSSLHKVKVKICGITNLEDAKNAIDAGADILGFNFYTKSPRYIPTAKATEIIKNLPNTVQTVGVFVNSPAKEVKEIQKQTGIDFIQLHGDETEKFCKQIGANTIKAQRVKEKLPTEKELIYARLYDTFDPNAFGGTGKTFDKKLLKQAKGKIIVAGGLKIDNVNESIQSIHPYALDTCSGVESTLGKKDKTKMINFIQKVRENDN
ncbi:MAG: bifunctional indole-3-glycerol-phosphate synthase TrpC/phosphoribosylanthranilate isomerase TrpF [archaeon]|jgi:indole-3-glycerol phosphate synthase/phosphoribosylanthranilate isomerase